MKAGKDPHTQPFVSTGVRGALPRVLQSVCVGAASVDVFYIAFFLWFDSPWLAWVNLISIALYAAAYRLLRRQQVRAAVFLIWLEAFPHAIYGTLMIGWSSGFHYLLLMFVPSVVMTSRRKQGAQFIGAMVVFLVALYVLSETIAPLKPIDPWAVEFLGIAHFVIFVLLFSWSTDHYRGQLMAAERQLQSLATLDPLTNLINRRQFSGMAERALSQADRSAQPSCIAMLDIDHFKRVNDSHGHDAGDLVLVAIAKLMTSQVRKYDLLARWGGEEFVLFMPNTTVESAQDVLERIRNQVQESSVQLPKQAVSLTISIGMTQVAAHEKLGVALTRADQALYQSKTDGRNRLSVV